VERDKKPFHSCATKDYSLYALLLAIPPPWGSHLSKTMDNRQLRSIVLNTTDNRLHGEEFPRAGQGLNEGTKGEMQPAAGQASHRHEKEISDAASGAADKTSTRQRDELCSEQHCWQDVSKREK
jgi:hypothetical protein